MEPQSDQTVPVIPFWCVFVDCMPCWLGEASSTLSRLAAVAAAHSQQFALHAGMAFCSSRTGHAAVNKHVDRFPGIIGLMQCSCT